MAQSGTVASGGSVDIVVAAYERLRIYDAGGLVGTSFSGGAGRVAIHLIVCTAPEA